MLQVNAQSLNKKYDDLVTFLRIMPKLPDVLCISVTWLKPNTAPLHEIDGFKSYHTHRPDDFGGVATPVNSVLFSDYWMCDENVELGSVRITVASSSCITASLYRPHSKHHRVNEFSASMDNFLSQSISTDKKSIISGYFNINLLEQYKPTNK